MNRYKNWTLSLLIALSSATALATPSAARAPIEKFEFTEVLNLKSKAQIGRTKVAGWADNLLQEANAGTSAAQATAKAPAPQARKTSAERQAAKSSS